MTKPAVVATLLLGALSAAAENRDTDRALFTVEYGWEVEKIGGHSPLVRRTLEQGSPLLSGIAVDYQRNVWLGDAKDCVVKGFTRVGEFLRAPGYRRLRPSDLPHEAHELPSGYRGPAWAFVTNLIRFATSLGGYSYLLVNPDTRVIVFDDNGERVHAKTGVQGICSELHGGEKITYRLRQETNALWPLIENVWCDVDNNLYLAIGDSSGPREATPQAEIAKFTGNLDFLGWRPGHHVGPDGSTYALAANGNSAPLTKLDKFGADGHPAGSIAIVPPDGEAGLDFDPERGWTPPEGIAIDGQGNVHLIYSSPAAKRSVPGWDAVEVDVQIYVFHPTGEFLSCVSLPSVAKTTTPPPVAVDLFGHIYYAVYKQDCLEVRWLERVD